MLGPRAPRDCSLWNIGPNPVGPSPTERIRRTVDLRPGRLRDADDRGVPTRNPEPPVAVAGVGRRLIPFPASMVENLGFGDIEGAAVLPCDTDRVLPLLRQPRVIQRVAGPTADCPNGRVPVLGGLGGLCDRSRAVGVVRVRQSACDSRPATVSAGLGCPPVRWTTWQRGPVRLAVGLFRLATWRRSRRGHSGGSGRGAAGAVSGSPHISH